VKRDQIVSRLRQIEALVLECLQAAGEKPNRTIPSRKPSRSIAPAKNTLPNHIIALRDKGFFARPQTAGDVQAKLNPTYVCEFDRVSMALLRLVERRKLRKSSKMVAGKKQVAYVW
jgi:hypothetical protein